MRMVLVTSMHFVLQRNTSDVFRIAEYQPEGCLLDFNQISRDASTLSSFRIAVEREVHRDVTE
jgi:hypothetical protein